MTFNPCSDCGGGADWAEVGRLAFLWFVPTVLFVFLRQLPDHHLLALIRPIYWFSIVVALVVTLMGESSVGLESEISIVGVPVFCVEFLLCGLAVLADTYAHRASPSRSS
jgi:cell division protein FtsW (lipid II flippase)